MDLFDHSNEIKSEYAQIYILRLFVNVSVKLCKRECSVRERVSVTRQVSSP